jgi:hypothetical protein
MARFGSPQTQPFSATQPYCWSRCAVCPLFTDSIRVTAHGSAHNRMSARERLNWYYPAAKDRRPSVVAVGSRSEGSPQVLNKKVLVQSGRKWSFQTSATDFLTSSPNSRSPVLPAKAWFARAATAASFSPSINWIAGPITAP